MTTILTMILKAMLAALQPTTAPVAAVGDSPSLDLIKRFEGLRLEAYLCPAKVWTIGFGHTKGVKRGDVITRTQANDFLALDMGWVILTVKDTVLVPLNINQEAALYSFIYNVGGGAFARSTMLRRLNKGNYADAANEFKRWNRGGGKVLNGLIRRREAEAALFRKAL